MRRSMWLPVGAGASTGALLLGATWTVGPITSLPLAVGLGAVVAGLAGWPTAQRWLPLAAAAAAVVSLAATATAAWSQLPAARSAGVLPYVAGPAAGALGLVEAAALLVLLALVVRIAGPRMVVVVSGLLVAADLGWLLRVPTPPLNTAAGLVTLLLWFAGPVIAGIAGGYPRLAEIRRDRSVHEAQREQRLRLARDLHDFVAHDVTGIVVQAQAAQHVGQHDPTIALDALRRIETAGQHALGSIDQALDLLRQGDPVPDGLPAVTAHQLATLLDRFAEAGGAVVEARVDERAWRLVPAELSALGYRVLAEALTNVRRHAPEAGRVRVAVARTDGRVELVVSNPMRGSAPRGPRRGGRGLRQLAALAADGGGALTAGPQGREWQLRLVLPVGAEASP